MDTMQKNLKISILGKIYLINTDEQDDDITQAAQMVDHLLKSKADKASLNNEGKLAIVVALQLAADLTKNKKMLKSYEEKIAQLTSLLNAET